MIDGLAISFANVMINIVDEHKVSENLVNYLGILRTTFMFLSGIEIFSFLKHTYIYLIRLNNYIQDRWLLAL